MALETLLGIKEIGGFKVEHEGLDAGFHSDHHIVIDHGENIISFKIQNGPIKEVGVNGCQVDTLIHAARHIIEGLNKKFPCGLNKHALRNLGQALAWLDARKADRERRGVEGRNQP
jgi:hypothetical protein